MKYRNKCCVLAAIDLVWRIGDLLYATAVLLFPKLRDVMRTSDSEVTGFTVMDDRVYDFLLSPILTLLYFMAFFLQVSISIFLCKSCTGKSIPENERAACVIWSRIAVVSIVILLIRFFLPKAILTIFNVAYNGIRVFIKSITIYVVLKHEKELRKNLDPSQSQYNHDKRDEDYAIPTITIPNLHEIGGSTTTTPIPYAKTSKPINLNQVYVRPRVQRGMEYFEKQWYTYAIAELKAARGFSPDDINLIKLEETLQILQDFVNSNQKDHYSILGVPRTMSLEGIKRAYRRKSLRHHPDKHVTDSEKVQRAETRHYQEIREAYDVLLDPERRENYDMRLERDRQRIHDYETTIKNLYSKYSSQI